MSRQAATSASWVRPPPASGVTQDQPGDGAEPIDERRASSENAS